MNSNNSLYKSCNGWLIKLDNPQYNNYLLFVIQSPTSVDIGELDTMVKKFLT